MVKKLPVPGFELWIPDVGSDQCATNCANAVAQFRSCLTYLENHGSVFGLTHVASDEYQVARNTHLHVATIYSEMDMDRVKHKEEIVSKPIHTKPTYM